MSRILRWPWAQGVLWVAGVFSLLIGAGGDFGTNWGAVVAGAVFVAAAIALAFLRTFRKKTEPASIPSPVAAAPLTNEQRLKRSRRTRFVVASIVVFAVSIAIFSTARKFSRFLDVYENIAINSTRAEVRYRLGPPPMVLGELESGEFPGRPGYYTDRAVDPLNAMPEGTDPDDYDIWSYGHTSDSDQELMIEFDEAGLATEVSCMQMNNPYSSCSPLFGVRIGDSEEEMIARLGHPNSERISGPSKIIRYTDIGVEFTLTRGRVYRLTLTREKGEAHSIFLRYVRGWFSWW